MHVPNVTPERNVETNLTSPPGPVTAVFLDLPLANGGAGDHQPRIAVTTEPWTERMAVYRSQDDDAYELAATIAKPAVIGTTIDPLPPGRPGRWQRVSLRVAVQTGALASADQLRVLNGANTAAIEFSPGEWEIIQFRDAALTAPGEYILSTLLRGQRGTDALGTGAAPANARFVLMDDALVPLLVTLDERALPRHYQVGPTRIDLSHPSYRHSVETFTGVGLRRSRRRTCWLGAMRRAGIFPYRGCEQGAMAPTAGLASRSRRQKSKRNTGCGFSAVAHYCARFR